MNLNRITWIFGILLQRVNSMKRGGRQRRTRLLERQSAMSTLAVDMLT